MQKLQALQSNEEVMKKKPVLHCNAEVAGAKL
jgi:hypothetical protein